MSREQQRANLYKVLNKLADGNRGSLGGQKFKNYVFIFTFYKFLSDNITKYINKNEKDVDFEKLTNESKIQELKEAYREIKGFFIEPKFLFNNVLKNYEEENFNEILSNAFTSIEETSYELDSEEDFKGLFKMVDLTDELIATTLSSRNKKIKSWMEEINNLELNSFEDSSIDIFGDAFEYLMALYAAAGGKAGGEFYTPQEVSELLIKVASLNKENIHSIYDPTCGSGSLLLQASKILEINDMTDGLYGQEESGETHNLARMNMFLHNVKFNKFHIHRGDTLEEPKEWFNQDGSKINFDIIVSNPPYSIPWAGDKNPNHINDSRFSPAGVLAPKPKADFAFIMHSLAQLNDEGKAAIVCFPGITYRGGTEQKIRKYLTECNFIDTVINLPKDIFFGTSIETIILVLNKNKKDNNILFVDGANEFIKITNGNKLSETNIENILGFVKERKDVQHISSLISNEKVIENNVSWMVGNYVETLDTSEKIDIVSLENEIEIENKNITESFSKIKNLLKSIGY
ncbi:MAG: type I restriction-modification system subunit M [Mycoplasma sp.]